MQMQSDLSAIEVQRYENAEATALGASYLAGLAVGFFESREALRALSGGVTRFTPEMDAETRAERLDGWHRAVEACRTFTKGGA
jgi:glycerol kinase